MKARTYAWVALAFAPYRVIADCADLGFTRTNSTDNPLDLSGTSLAVLVLENEEDCCQKCANISACQGFMVVEQECHFKSTSEIIQGVYLDGEYVYTYPKPPPPPFLPEDSSCHAYTNPVADVELEPSNKAFMTGTKPHIVESNNTHECCTMCHRKAGCVGFTIYTIYNTTTCYLKNSRTQVSLSNNSGAFSYLLPHPPPPSQPPPPPSRPPPPSSPLPSLPPISPSPESPPPSPSFPEPQPPPPDPFPPPPPPPPNPPPPPLPAVVSELRSSVARGSFLYVGAAVSLVSVLTILAPAPQGFAAAIGVVKA